MTKKIILFVSGIVVFLALGFYFMFNKYSNDNNVDLGNNDTDVELNLTEDSSKYTSTIFGEELFNSWIIESSLYYSGIGDYNTKYDNVNLYDNELFSIIFAFHLGMRSYSNLYDSSNQEYSYTSIKLDDFKKIYKEYFGKDLPDFDSNKNIWIEDDIVYAYSISGSNSNVDFTLVNEDELSLTYEAFDVDSNKKLFTLKYIFDNNEGLKYINSIIINSISD